MFRHLAARLSTLLAVSLTFAACAGAPPRMLPEITFGDQPPIAFDVARIEVVQRYSPPLADPYVEHLLAQEPATVIRRWSGDRIAARGASGTATLYIEEASIAEETLARSPGLRGTVTIEESERYTATFRIRLEIDDPATGRSGFSNVRAQRAVTVLETATLSDREETWFELTEMTVRDLDAEFEKQARQNLTMFLIR